MNIKLQNQIGAQFKLVAHKGDPSTPERETEWFHNIVLDSGLDQMSVGTWIDRCCVGSGNSTPVASQTALENFIASTTTRQGSEQSLLQTSQSPIYYGTRFTWRFGLGIAAGNLSEVGMGWANDRLWNRALIRDSEGTPVTITVLSDEYLDVICEIRVYPQESFSGSFNLRDKAGEIVSTHTYEGRPVISGGSINNSWAMGRISFNWSSYNYNFKISPNAMTNVYADNGGTSVSYSSNTYPTSRSVRGVSAVGLDQVVFAHRSFQTHTTGFLSAGNGFKWEINPPITKTAQNTMTYSFEMSWGRRE